MRRPGRQQDRCQMLLAEESNNTYGNPHGFALSRTVSCRKTRHNKAQKSQKGGFVPDHSRHPGPFPDPGKNPLCFLWLFVANALR